MTNKDKKYTDMQLTAFMITCIVLTYVITSAFYIGLGKSMIEYKVQKLLNVEYRINGTLYNDINYAYVNKSCNISSCSWINHTNLKDNVSILFPDLI